MKLYIENYACMNRSDELSILKSKFINNKKFIITNDVDDADYILIYTCGSTEAFIRRSFEAVEKIYKQYPQKRIIVCGCSTVTARYLYDDMNVILCSPTNFHELD